MPEISRFLGIIILMHFREHNPPHFHVEYNEFAASVLIETLGVMEGKLPPRVVEPGSRVGRVASGGIAGELECSAHIRSISPD
ncbi:MAG: DUF4160 domain-containing protein [Thermodesulfovibrionales bacterium]|jgi:hypothetical protein